MVAFTLPVIIAVTFTCTLITSVIIAVIRSNRLTFRLVLELILIVVLVKQYLLLMDRLALAITVRKCSLLLYDRFFGREFTILCFNVL